MKTKRFLGLILLSLAALLLQKAAAQPLDLTTYPSMTYTQTFDSLGYGVSETSDGTPTGTPGFLPGEWICYTNAHATYLGSPPAGAPNGSSGGIIDFWGNGFIGQFKNYASYFDYIGGTNFTGSEGALYQTNEPNRCLGIRQIGAFGDPFAGIVLNLANTVDFHNFVLSLDMMNLDKTNASRTAIWTVDWAVQDPVYLVPTSFYPIARYTNTPANTFHFIRTNIVFPDGTINNVNARVYIRIATLQPTSGSGNRQSFAIDNVGLTWQAGAGGCTPVSLIGNPAPTTVYSNASATFSVSVAATSPIYYQWFKDGVGLNDGGNIFGSRSYQLSVNNASTADMGSYSCQISNECSGTVYVTNSTGATLTITNPPAASIAYLHTLVDPASFAATNSTLFWQATGLITTATNITTGNTASYYLQDGTGGINLFVTGGSSFRPNIGDEVTIVGFLSTFGGNLEIEADITGAVPANNATSVEILSNNIAAYPTPLVVSWTNLFMGNGTNANLTYNYMGSQVLLTNVYFGTNANKTTTATASPTYVVTNANGRIARVILYSQVDNDMTNRTTPTFAYSIQGPLIGTSAGYAVGVTRWSDVNTNGPAGPAISGVVNQTNVVGTTAAFNATVGGFTPLGLQWRFNGNPLSDNGHITGSTTASLSINNVSAADAGTYALVASNWVGTATSAATLTVKSPAAIPLNVQTSGGGAYLSFNWSDPSFSLAEATNVLGPYVKIPGAVSGYTLGTTNSAMFFRLIWP
jgi:hypothetical protein